MPKRAVTLVRNTQRVLPHDVLTHGFDPCAVTAAAHKLARLIYTMPTNGQEYTDQGQDYYDETLVTSTSEVAVPGIFDLLDMRFDDGMRLQDLGG